MDLSVSKLPLKRLMSLVLLAALAWAVFTVYHAVSAKQTMGILKVVGSPNMTISVSRNDTAAKVIGVGSAQAHLTPGVYLVAGSLNGNQTFQSVQLTKQRTTDIQLNIPIKPVQPSVQSINFSGFDDLINNGMSASQLNSLKYAFFKFQPRAQKVEVVAGSIQPGPHNPDSAGFSLNFQAKIDDSSYKATVNYSTLSSVRLFLFKASGKKLFDSKLIVSPI